MRIMTYNVHGCVGVDRKLDVGRVAAVIAQCKPDIVALQELDVCRARSGNVDQAHAIASRLGMTFHFNSAMNIAEERYGDAVLTNLAAAYALEHLEIATLAAIAAAAETIDRRDLADTCRGIVAEDAAMASWLLGFLPDLTKAYLGAPPKGR